MNLLLTTAYTCSLHLHSLTVFVSPAQFSSSVLLPSHIESHRATNIMNTFPAEKGPTAQEIRTWGHEKLLEWIQGKLSVPLAPEDKEEFLRAKINGNIFLKHADDPDFFEKKCKLPVGPSECLADLAEEIIGRKSKCCLSTLRILRPQPAKQRHRGQRTSRACGAVRHRL